MQQLLLQQLKKGEKMSVKNLDGEIWKVIDHPSIGYYPNYMVSNMGRVKSLNYRRTGGEKLLKQSKIKFGYLLVGLRKKNEKQKWILVHRLVALMFIKNPDNLPCINHKDENKTNNRLENLEFCSIAYNNVYGNGGKIRKEHIAKLNAKKRKQVYQYTTDGKLVDVYSSQSEAGRKTGNNQSNIGACCRGEITNLKGFIWSYTQLTDNQISVLIASMKKNKPVYQYDLNLQLINIYKNINEAAQLTGFKKGSIGVCCCGHSKTHKKFIWSYEPLECFQYTLFPLTETKVS